MKVSELIDCLQGMPQDMEVKITYNSGDYWKTSVLDRIDICDIALGTWSDYHDKYRIAETADDCDEKAEEFVVIG